MYRGSRKSLTLYELAGQDYRSNMQEKPQPRDLRTLVHQLRTSENPYVALLREAAWVLGVVGGIALILFLFAGTWPAAVTIESTSMVPHMNVGDLVIVMEKDRFGGLQTWTDGKASGRMKYGDYGDVIIYRPNGAGTVHPIIHRAMTEIGAGKPVPIFANPYRGQVTPLEYRPLTVSNMSVGGYAVLYNGTLNASWNITADRSAIGIRSAIGQYIIPSEFQAPGAGYVWESAAPSPHAGYITKGDNNGLSDQATAYQGLGQLEPVKEEWVVGKALFVVPLIGYLPLHIVEVAIVVFGLMILYELYQRRKSNAGKPGQGRPPGRKRKD
jgi:signal peptidase